MDREIYQPLIGYGALLLSFSYRIPQLLKLWRTKSGSDISQKMIHLQNTSYVLYVVYGILISDLVYILSSMLSIIQNLIILAMVRYFKNNPKPTLSTQNLNFSLQIK